MHKIIPTANKIAKDLYKFIDIKQPEVRWAGCISILLEFFFVFIKFYSNFLIYESELRSLLQGLIAGLISLIGIAITGIAIVIVLFSTEQIKMIDEIRPNAFESLLYDFKWLALVSTFETALFIAVIFVIRSPYPLVHVVFFYVIVFLLVYGVFYLLFYGCALIGNCIKLSKIRSTLDEISMRSKSALESAIELQIDYLVSMLFQGDKKSAFRFYSELICLIETSSIKNKKEVIQYLADRYGKTDESS